MKKSRFHKLVVLIGGAVTAFALMLALVIEPDGGQNPGKFTHPSSTGTVAHSYYIDGSPGNDTLNAYNYYIDGFAITTE